MQTKPILIVLTSALALASPVRAELDGSGHYISGMMSDFSTTVPGVPGWNFVNFFLCYDNGRAGGQVELPFGPTLAQGVKAQTYSEIPAVLYGTPFLLLGGQPALGLAIPYVWEGVSASSSINVPLASKSGTLSDWASGFGDLTLM